MLGNYTQLALPPTGLLDKCSDGKCENSTLVTLELAANGIGLAGADAIADALRENSAIVKLNLYGGHAGVDEPFGLSERETKSRIDTIIAENLKSRRAARLAARLLLPRLHLPEGELVRKILLCLLPPTVVESTMPGVDASADPAAVRVRESPYLSGRKKTNRKLSDK